MRGGSQSSDGRLVQITDDCLYFIPQAGNIAFDHFPYYVQIDGKVTVGKLVAHSVNRSKGYAGKFRGCIGNRVE